MTALLISICVLNPFSLIADCRIVYESPATLSAVECISIGRTKLHRAMLMDGALIGKAECGPRCVVDVPCGSTGIVIFARKDEEGRIHFDVR